MVDESLDYEDRDWRDVVAPPAGETARGAYTCDAEGLITYFNQRAVELWGRTPKLNEPEERFCGSFRLYSTDGTPMRHDQCWMELVIENDEEYHGR